MPIIPDYQPVKGNYTPAAPSLGAAMAGGKALADVGRDISGAGELGMEAATRYRREKELDTLNRGREAMQTVLAEHEEFRAKSPDNEDKWEGDVRERISRTKAEVLNTPGLSPEAKGKLKEQFTAWENEYSAKARGDALKYGSAKARTRVTRLSRSYRDKGDFESSRRVVKEAIGTSLSDSEGEMDLMDIDAEEADHKKKGVVTSYELGAIDDPVRVIESLNAKNEAGEFINDPDMDKGARARLMKHAERSLDQHQGEEFNLMIQAIDEGKLSGDEIQRVPVFLDDNQKKALAAHYQRNQPPTDEEDRTAWKEIDRIRLAYTEAKAGSLDEVAYRKAHRDARTKIIQMIPQGYSGPLMESLQHYSPARIYDMKPNAPPSREDVKKDLSIEVRSTLSAAYDAQLLGPSGPDTPPMEKEKAARKRRDLENKALDWISTQKDLTPEGARAYTDSLLSTERVKSTAKDLRQFVPGSAQRLRPAPAMPPLPPKQSAKDKATADPLQIPPGDGNASAALLPAKQLDTFLDQ